MLDDLYDALVAYFTINVQSDMTFHKGMNSIIVRLEEPSSCGYSSQVNNINEFISKSNRFRDLFIDIDGDYEKEFEIEIIAE